MVKEAKNRGIKVTDSEVKDFIKKMRASMAQMPDEEKQFFNDYLQGLGMSEDEFWSSKEVFNGYKKGLYIGRLREQFMKDANTSEEIRKANSEFEKFENNLVEGTKIEIVDPDIFK
ncbi:MAG: hypothetical protein IBX64_02825 [Actinobacteria bacterium]|nr:hypothetical protein [Actinomycetota bacterium]